MSGTFNPLAARGSMRRFNIAVQFLYVRICTGSAAALECEQGHYGVKNQPAATVSLSDL